MARHRKPPRHRTRTTLIATAPIVGLPLTSGVAHAAPLDWDSVSTALAICESGNRATAANPNSTASGRWQLLDSTWRAMGGAVYARRAKYATPAQQELVAKRLFLRAGLSPWKASQRCWRRLIGKITPKRVVPAPSERVYRIQPGDTLSELAARTGHTWQDLFEANRQTVSDPGLIHVGVSINLL